MARLTDHDLRDAEDAVRKELSLYLGRYSRRMLAQAKAYVEDEIAKAVRSGEEIDGHTIGRAAFARVRTEFFKTASKPKPPIDTRPSSPTQQLRTSTDTDSDGDS